MIKKNPAFQITYHTFEQKERIEFLIQKLQNDSSSISCQTSGSTGKPKLIYFDKNSLKISAQNSIDYFNLQENQVAVLCISVDFVAGIMMLVRAMIAGMKLHVTPVKKNTFKYVRFKADFIALFPKQLDFFLNDRQGVKTLMKINSILVGGAPISSKTESQLISNGITIYQSYGMTETLTHVAIKKTGFMGNKVYQSLPGISFTESNGCLEIDYPALLNEKLITNDIVELIDSSSFKWLGRADFIINSGGYKISPEQLEQKISAILDCEFMVTAVKDTEFGQKTGLIFKGSAPNYINKKMFSQIMHPYEIPKLYTVLNDFYTTENGKLDRKMTTLKSKKSVWKKIL